MKDKLNMKEIIVIAEKCKQKKMNIIIKINIKNNNYLKKIKCMQINLKKETNNLCFLKIIIKNI